MREAEGEAPPPAHSDVYVHLQNGRFASSLGRAITTAGGRMRRVRDVAALDAGDGRGRAFILDRFVAGEDMLHVVEAMRGRGVRLPIIVLAGDATAPERIAALRAGADECLGKPVVLEELLLRLASLYDRYRRETTACLTEAGLRLDFVRRSVNRDGTDIDLLTKEFQVLRVLMENVDRTVSRAHLLSTVWEDRMRHPTNVVDVTIGTLRRKLDVEGEPGLIHSVRGVGFLFGRRQD